MPEQFNESIELLTAGQITINLNPDTGDILIGGNGLNGDVLLFQAEIIDPNESSPSTVHINAEGFIRLGGNGVGGNVRLFRRDTLPTDEANATIHLNGEGGIIRIGNDGVNGSIFIEDENGNNVISMQGQNGNIVAGGHGKDGDILMRNTLGQTRIHFSAGGGAPSSAARIHLDGGTGNIILGGNDADGDILMRDTSGQTRIHFSGGGGEPSPTSRIHLNGGNGIIRCHDVRVPGADFAEDFDVSEVISLSVEPGSVMVLNTEGKLEECTTAYDHKVAGVISGAGKFKPGVILDNQINSRHRMPIALSGKVMCKVDSNFGEIEVGDLLTTSSRKGYAMKASDSTKAFGSIIGKALGNIRSGDGLIPILVSLH